MSTAMEILAEVQSQRIRPDELTTLEYIDALHNGVIQHESAHPYYYDDPLGILYANSIGPAGIGAANMINNTVTGGLGYVLGAAGRGWEAISPISGEGQGGDSWLTSAAKGVLGVHNYFDDAITRHRSNVMGENPNTWQKIVEGTGSTGGFILTGTGVKALAAAKGLAKPLQLLLGALAESGTEALSETGGFMGDAYREGKYDNGALDVGTANFAANWLLNFALDKTLGRYGKSANKVINPYTRGLRMTLEEVLNENLQEPSQQIIEQASKRALDRNILHQIIEQASKLEPGQDVLQYIMEQAAKRKIDQDVLQPITKLAFERAQGQDISQPMIEEVLKRELEKDTSALGVFSELWNNGDIGNDWLNATQETFIDTTGSTLLTQGLFGLGAVSTKQSRDNIRRQHKASQMGAFWTKDGDLRIPSQNVDQAINFARTEDVSNPNDPITNAVYTEIWDKRKNLQIALNEAHADMSDPNAMQNIQNIQNQIIELDNILDKFVPYYGDENTYWQNESAKLEQQIASAQSELDNIPNQINYIYENQAEDLDTNFDLTNQINELQARQQQLQASIPNLQAQKKKADARIQRLADYNAEQEHKRKEQANKNNNDDNNQPPAPPTTPATPTDVDDSQIDMFADYDDLINQDNDNQNQDDDSEVTSERNNLIRQIAEFTRTHTDEEIATNPELSNQLNTMLNSLNELETEARKQQGQQNSGTTMSLSEINSNLAEYDELDKKINKAAQDIEAGRDVNRAEYEANLKRYNEIEKQLAQVDTSKHMPKSNRKRIIEIKQKRSAIDSHLSNMADKGAAWRAQNPDNAENLDVDNFLNSKPKPIEVENISNKLKAEREKIQKRVDKSSAILGTESDVDTQALSDLQDLQARISALNDKISKLENYNHNYSRQQNSNNNDANLVTPMADTQQNTTQTQQPKTTKSKRQVTVDENGEINLYPYSGRKGLLYTRKAELDVKLKNAKMNGDEAAVKEITEELQKIAEEIGDIIEADEYPVILQNAQYIMERNAYEAEHGEGTFMSREEWDNLHPLSSYAEGARKIREAKRTGKAAAHKTNNDANLVTPMTDEQQTQKPKPMDKKSNPDLFIEKPSPAGVQADLVDMRNGLTDDEFKEFKEIIRRAKTENNPADMKRIREIFANARKRILTDDDGNPLGKRKSKKKASKKSSTEKKEKRKTNKELEQEAVKRATQNLDAETLVDDEPDPKLDEQTVSTDNDLSLDSVMRIVQEETGNQDSAGESYNQSYQNGVVNDDKDLFIGKFTFSTKGKKYSLNVIVQQEINDDRLSRLRGRAIELRNNNGEVIATYYPYTNEFEFHKTGVNHSQAWLNSFEAQFRQHLQEYMYNGGFIDAQGKFIKDGNEDFRERWKARNENDPDAIFSDEQEPEDFEKPREIATLRVTQNGQPRNFKVVTGEYTGKYQEQRRLFGRILNIYDENGKLVARYSPYAKILQFSAAYKSNSEIKSQITEQINKNRTTLLKAGNFLDENGKLKSDGNEEYRRKYIERQKNKGKKIKVRTIQGTEIEARYKIVEADDLIVSTLETGAPNPAYPQELQPRQRNREASHQQIAGMAANIDPELLAENRLVSDGAPVVGSDKVVESGNGKTLALKRAYKTNSAGNYKTWLRDNAKRFGYTAEDVDKFTNPVLVRERISDVDRVQFTREANDTSVSRMSTTETAMNDSKRITESMLLLYDPNKSLAANKDFINAFLKSIPQSERGEFLQKNGNVSKAGLFRIENALIAKAYNDISIMDRLSELIDDDIKNVSNALISAAPKIALLENLGNRPELSLRNDIMQAINILADLRQNSTKVAEYLAQIPMFADEDKVTPAAKKLLKFFDDNIRSAKKIAAGLINYAETAANEAKENQGTLPGMDDSKRSKENILSQAIKETYKQSAENGTDTDSDNNDSTKDKYEKLYDELEEKFTDENGVIDDDKVDEAFWKQVKEDAEGRRSIIDRAIDKLAKKYANAKRALSEKIDDIFVGIGDIFANDEDYRKVYKKVYLLFRNSHHHNFGRHEAAAIANVVATITRYYSRMTGVSQDDFFNNCGLKIKFDKSREARYKRDNNKNIVYQEYTDEYGRKHKSPKIELIRGRYENRNIEPGSLFREANYIITLFEDDYRHGKYIPGSDVSTVIHEVLGHFQLNNLRTLYRNGQLKDTALQDFQTLIKWLGVSDLDLTRDYKQESKEGKRWQDAHEKFAVGMEKYFREGNAPTKKLKRAFESMRRWLYGIYYSMSNMAYEGSDGNLHVFTINDDIRRVFDNMFADLDEKRVRTEARNDTRQGSEYGEGESYNQSAGLDGRIEFINTKGKRIAISHFSAKKYRNTVLRIQKDTLLYRSNVNSNATFEEIKNALTKQYEAEIRQLEQENGETSHIEALQERINFLNEISDIKITFTRSDNTHKNLTPELGHTEENSKNTEAVSSKVKMLPRVELINSEGENFTLDNVRGNNALAFPRVKHDIMRYLEEVRYNPSLEEIKRVLTDRYEEEIKQVEAGNGKRKNSSISKIQDRIRFLDKISDIRIINNSQSGNIERYNQTLKQEAQTWSENVDKVLNGEFSSGAHIKVMETPRVFNLIGAKSFPIYMDADKINYVLTKHTALTPEIIKQIPTAISDPIAIFKSATHPNDSIIVMTELIDNDGGTIVVPVQLDVQQDSYQINRIASIYAKKNEKTGQVKNEWFSEQVNNGRLLYINNKKSSQWSTRTGLQLPVGSSNENMNSIPNENDLAKIINKFYSESESYNQISFNGKPSKGFITSEQLERYNQMATHATGHIILGNRFNLKYVGTGEGSKMFGHGIYLEENPEVAEAYRMSGLRNGGLISVNFTDSNGKTSEDYKIKKIDNIDYETDHDLYETENGPEIINFILSQYFDFSQGTPFKEIKENLKKGLEQDINVDYLRKDFDEAQKDEKLLEELENIDDINLSYKRGNIYKTLIPDNDDLLNWDAPLKKQSPKIRPIIRKAFNLINNPAKCLSIAFSPALKSENSTRKLERLIQSLENKFYNKIYSRDLSEYDEIRELLTNKDEDILELLSSAIEDFVLHHYSLKDINLNSTGEDLYWALCDIPGLSADTMENASMFLNTLGIPGHFYLDGLSREKGKGTHNFVIWNEDKLKILGLTEDSDQDAKDYFAEMQARLKNTSPKNVDMATLEDSSKLVSEEQAEKYNQKFYHGTGHILLDSRFDLSKMNSGEGSQYFGYGAYLAQNILTAQTYRRSGLPYQDIFELTQEEKDSITITTKNGSKIKFTERHKIDDKGMLNILEDIAKEISFAKSSEKEIDTNSIKNLLKWKYQVKIDTFSLFGKSDVSRAKKALKALKNITHIEAKVKTKKGNVYLVDAPENDVLLSWDETLDNQPKHVKKAINKIIASAERIAKLHRVNITESYDTEYPGVGVAKNIYAARTGQELYWALTALFDKIIDKRGLRKKTDKTTDKTFRADKYTSELFNRFGVPGHRFWDRQSRNTKSGTYNAVIWDVDTLKMLGLTEDSTREAKDYFTETQARLQNTSPKNVDLDNDNELITEKQIENYNQYMTHATGNILLNNEFNLKYIGTGEGSQAFGYGAYLEENPAVAEVYRKFGIPINLPITLHTKDGLSITSSSFNDPYFEWHGQDSKRFYDKFFRNFEYELKTQIKNNKKSSQPRSEAEIAQSIFLDMKTAIIDKAKAGIKTLRGVTIPKIHAMIAERDGEANWATNMNLLDMLKLAEESTPDYEKQIQTIEQLSNMNLLDMLKLAEESTPDYEKQIQAIEQLSNMNLLDMLKLAEESIPDYEKQIQAIEQLSNIELGTIRNGNIYKFEGPDNDILLDWDEKLTKQSEHVRKAIIKIKHALKRRQTLKGSDLSAIERAKTGEDLYRAISNIMYQYEKSRTPSKINEQLDRLADKKTSLLFNKFGIPGHRFFDKFSRKRKSGTHNFVIWDMNALKLLGLTENSDEEAKDYFEKTKIQQERANNRESYNQPINQDVNLDDNVNIVKISTTMPNVPFWQRSNAFDKSREEEIINRFKNNKVVNEHTGLIITLSKHGLNHILNTARNYDNIQGKILYQSVAYLDKLAQNAYRVETHQDRKPSKTKVEGQSGNLRQVHRFLVPIEFNDEQHILKLTAKEL